MHLLVTWASFIELHVALLRPSLSSLVSLAVLTVDLIILLLVQLSYVAALHQFHVNL